MSTIFQAVWPITTTEITDQELIAEALTDLPFVAARHKVKVTGQPAARIEPGKNLPGTGEADWCVVIEAPAIKSKRQERKGGDVVPCGRCGIERTGGSREYCADCKPYAMADGWIEAAA